MRRFCQLLTITKKSLIIKTKRWFLSLLEILLPTVLVILLFALRTFQPPTFSQTKLNAVRGLPSSGIFSVFQSFCPSDDVTLDENGFQHSNGSKEYEFLELLDEISRFSFNSTLPFDDLLLSLTDILSRADSMKEEEMDCGMIKQHNESIREEIKKIECYLHQTRNDDEMNNKIKEIQHQLEIIEKSEKLMDKIQRLTDMLPEYDPENYATGSDYLLKFMSEIICATDIFNKTQGSSLPTDQLNINNNQRNRLDLLFGVLRQNSTILFAPNNTAVTNVIQKANETLNVLADLNKLAIYYAETLETMQKENILHKLANHHEETMNHPVIDALYYSSHIIKRSINPFRSNSSYGYHKWRLLENSTSRSSSSIHNNDVFIGFVNETELVNFVQNADSTNTTILAGIVFTNVPKTAKKIGKFVEYKIRMKPAFTPSTMAARDVFASYIGPRDWDDSYYSYGFLFIQDIMERSMISILGGPSIIEPGSAMQEMAFPCYRYDRYLVNMQSIIPLVLAISPLYSLAILVENIVYEKEHGLKEMMHTMGADTTMIWLSWIFATLPQATITNILMVLLLYLNQSVFRLTNFMIVFLSLQLYTLSCISLSLLFSSIYSRARMATACSSILFFLFLLPSVFISIREQSTYKDTPDWLTATASIFSPSAFGILVKYLLYGEISGVEKAIGWNNLFVSIESPSGFSVGILLCILLFECISYGILAIYMDKVLPGPYGIARPWYYPIQPIINFIQKKSDEEFDEMRTDSTNEEESGMECSVHLSHVYKEFHGKSARRYAVKNLSLSFYKNEVTALLGDNGAGKSTTMKIISGHIAATKGYVEVEGIRRGGGLSCNVGLCPQHNVLFRSLSVQQHLTFYAEIKNSKLTRDEILSISNQMMIDLGLEKKKDCNAASLSGGMQRRLCIAIAFIGGCSTVILDEPTAGVDPYARRAIWDLIVKYKKGRSIIIATHLMDEADILSDRIAVISEGELKAIGPPVYLKQTYGDGYKLNISLKDDDDECIDRMMNWLKDAGPSVVVLSRRRTEILFGLSGWSDDELIKMLKRLESDSNSNDDFPMLSFGINDSTLEEIFIKLVGKTSLKEKMEDAKEMTETSSVKENHDLSHYPRLTSQFDITMAQIQAVVIKRYICASRSWKTLISQLLVPVLFVIMGMGVALPSLTPSSYPPIYISTAQYTNSSLVKIIFPYQNYESMDEYPYRNMTSKDKYLLNGSSLATQLYNPTGPGPICILNGPMYDWADANIINQTQENLDRIIDSSMFDRECFNWFPRCYDCQWTNYPLRHFLIPNDRESSKATCYCDKGTQSKKCDVFPPMKNIVESTNGASVYDVSGYNYTDWTIDRGSRKDFSFGGVNFGYQYPNVPFDYGVNTSLLLRKLAIRHVTKIMFDNRVFHSQPVYLNAWNNILLRSSIRMKGDDDNPGQYAIRLINHPFQSDDLVIGEKQILQNNDVLIAVFIVIALCFVPISFVFLLVSERCCNALHIQWMAGLSPLLYWTINFIFDIFGYSISAALTIFVIYMLGTEIYTIPSNLQAVTILIFLFGISMIPVVYLASRLFDNASTAYVVLVMSSLFFSIFSIFASFWLQMFGMTSKFLSDLDITTRHVFAFFPPFALGRGIMDTAFNQYYNRFYQFTNQNDLIHSIFQSRQLDKYFLGMTTVAVISTIGNIILAYWKYIVPVNMNCHENELEESSLEGEMLKEQQRIQSGAAKNDLLVVDNLAVSYSKSFWKPRLRAVRGVWWTVRHSECFGLLGVNGAGKTSSFRVLSGLSHPDRGKVLLESIPIDVGSPCLRRVGFCPQVDALYDEMTVSEHLIMLARIHSYPSNIILQLVTQLLSMLHIEEYSGSKAAILSGGTKRKLSLAQALIGDPSILLLDEPTTGMDPNSRFFLWQIIRAQVERGKSIVLTTHSMEECEALCTRTAIMVNGSIKCIGTPQFIKSTYGSGYSIRLRLKDRKEDTKDTIIQSFRILFPNGILNESHTSVIHLEVPPPCSVSSIFSFASSLLDTQIKTYSICQNGLDQAFVGFVREQKDEQDGSKANKNYLSMSEVCPVANESNTTMEEISSSSINEHSAKEKMEEMNKEYSNEIFCRISKEKSILSDSSSSDP